MLNNKNCLYILDKLERSGYSAYLVGGCVRDAIMGREIHDHDITTNALPQQICEVFSDDRVIPTGIKHGTVTILKNGESIEVTTFRVDGEYSDSRHPDDIRFTADITEDLSRRDFTMNAIAMDRNGNMIDPFNGRQDIENRIIRCVGDPEIRFTEDALRILRAVRFASVLDFDIEKNTADAALKLKERLDMISGERISVELMKLLGGDASVKVMMRFRDIMGQIIPELIPCFDFEQHSRYHKYDVYEHTVRAVSAVPKGIDNEARLRLAMLLHDTGKPDMFRLDENGVGHFKGHAGVSAVKARNVLKRLKFDNKTLDFVCEIISRHSDRIESERQIKRIINSIGIDGFLALIEAKKADNMAKRSFVLEENDVFDEFAETAKRLYDSGCCMSLRALDINGSDLMELGFKGREIGECLDSLLELVIDDVIPNEREELIKRAKEMLK